MLVLEKGLKLKWLGLLFALFAAIAGLGIGNMNQANTITELAREAIPDLQNWMVAVPLTLATGAVLIGGVRSIARVCAWLVPFMALFYGIGCILILLMNLEKFPAPSKSSSAPPSPVMPPSAASSVLASKKPCVTASPAVYFPMKPAWAALPSSPPPPKPRIPSAKA